LSDVRAGLDGVAFQCPGLLVRGDDIELQMLRLSARQAIDAEFARYPHLKVYSYTAA
jgi:hypothetical protein